MALQRTLAIIKPMQWLQVTSVELLMKYKKTVFRLWP